MLNKEKWPAGQLYGQQQQTERLDALKILQEYKCRLLIATDLAARGIDASNVDLVINFETPCNWETYLHRIGRAGRFGSYGLAITILSEGLEHNNFKSLIESLNLPFLVKDFWSNSPFCINNNTILEENDTPNKDKLDSDNISKPSEEVDYTKLWDALTGDEKRTEVESFDNLCESFTEPVNKIDLFNVLLQSFKQSEENAISENVNFSQLDLLNLPDKSHNIQELHKEKSKSLVNKTEMEAFLKHNGKSQTGTDCGKVILNNKHHYNIHSTLKDNLNSRNSLTKSSKINTPVTNHNGSNGTNSCDPDNGSNYELEAEIMSQALCDLKLPTPFSSSKERNPQNNNLTHTFNVNEVNTQVRKRDRHHNKSKLCTIVKTNKEFNPENRNKHTVTEVSNDSDEENYCTKLDLTKSRPRYCNHTSRILNEEMQLPSTSKYKNKSNKTKTHQSQNIYEYQNTKKDKKYMEWYNSLKVNVRQIEQMIYLNELSKL
ncbi:PREDICTED: probable ATP-dependent RNA helicase ddx20 isoform X2 [Papilio polytes]|nr:PREDICTED: probable ATP-dependent RNA helicase ddx20 isoform X2 [Papilio polytes]